MRSFDISPRARVSLAHTSPPARAPLARAALALALAGALGACTKAPPGEKEAAKTEATPKAAATSAPAPAPAPVAAELPKGTVYGPGVTAGTETVALSKILDEVDAYDGKRVRVEGMVTGVCEHRGCWIDIAGDREFETVRFKVQDGVITFPMSVKGKKVVAEGTVRKLAPPAEAAPAAGAAGEAHACDPGAAPGEGGGDCAAPAKARARLDGIGAVVVEGT